MTSIKLHGKLAESVGRDNWTLDISSVAEALHAINVQSKDGVKRFFSSGLRFFCQSLTSSPKGTSSGSQ